MRRLLMLLPLLFCTLMCFACEQPDYWDPSILDEEPGQNDGGRFNGFCGRTEQVGEHFYCARDGDFAMYRCKARFEPVRVPCRNEEVCYSDRDEEEAECVTRDELMHDIPDGVELDSDLWLELRQERDESK